EDGRRDRDVTGVQTCALPILLIVRDDFVEVERIEPLRIKTSEHLIDYNEQVNLLIVRKCWCVVRCLVRQPRSNVTLECRVRCHGEVLVKHGVVMLKYFEKSVFFSKLNLACVVDVGIK